ncbi:DUF6678 family protein, partial [Pseudoalteromonas luteoviolacea]
HILPVNRALYPHRVRVMSDKIQAKIEKSWDRLDSVISRKYSASYMSNTKWVKLFKAACPFYPEIQKMDYKLVYSDGIKSTGIEEYEEHIDDKWFIEPAIYKEIEWIEFPFEGNTKLVEFSEVLSRIGQFKMHNTSTGLRIIGYEKI